METRVLTLERSAGVLKLRASTSTKVRPTTPEHVDKVVLSAEGHVVMEETYKHHRQHKNNNNNRHSTDDRLATAKKLALSAAGKQHMALIQRRIATQDQHQNGHVQSHSHAPVEEGDLKDKNKVGLDLEFVIQSRTLTTTFALLMEEWDEDETTVNHCGFEWDGMWKSEVEALERINQLKTCGEDIKLFMRWSHPETVGPHFTIGDTNTPNQQ
eukprot:TRINITY_DN107077_c0_g1_i1.p1 TRINITY_DN107077_c0_g1~~TRINITY_DN107077_c0_g1_i1.p1  ORF type:complete len:213 (+),score=16.30 TRINITY_DN107077_c0_g1_i1:95-733(+)